jgi:phosphoribosylaminoimidazole (AIR) synthetase
MFEIGCKMPNLGRFTGKIPEEVAETGYNGLFVDADGVGHEEAGDDEAEVLDDVGVEHVCLLVQDEVEDDGH